MARPIQIARPIKGSGIKLNKEAMRKILLAGNIRNMPVIVISVAGAFRTGKSSLLNFILSYLRSSCRDQDWLSDRGATVEGFSWEGGTERHTTGIWLWSELFTVERNQGDKVAVLLMDTHGMFDTDTAIEDCLSMFVFAASVSSVLLYNVTHNIQENDLQRLGTFVQYGQNALAPRRMDVFQKLVFIVHDWNFPSEAPYGEKGGKEILNRRLGTDDAVPPELQILHKNIRSAFSDIECFLLPYPGRQVAAATSTDRRPCKMEDNFRHFIKNLAPFLLTPDTLVLKNDCGGVITCEILSTVMEVSMEAVSRRKLPVKARRVDELAAPGCKGWSFGNELCRSDLQPFNSPRMKQPTIRRRKQKTYQRFEKCSKYNKEKKFAPIGARSKLLKSTVLSSCMSCCSVLVGLHNLCNFFIWLAGMFFISLCAWVCVRCISDKPKVATAIDTTANFVWDRVGSGDDPFFN